MKYVKTLLIAALLMGAGSAWSDVITIGGVDVYFDGATDGETDWLAALAAFNAGHALSLEDFNDDPVTPDGPNGGPGTLGYGLAGPESYGGGDITMTLNDPGNGGSQVGIINPGEHDGSNALEMRLVDDTSDFELFPGFFIQGEGVQSIDFDFNIADVFAFAGEFHSTTTNDGLQINVAGVEIDLHDFYPDGALSDGDGFLGILGTGVTPGNGLSGFTFVTDQQVEPAAIFEQFEMDDFQYAVLGMDPPVGVPEPGTAALLLLGFAGLWVARRSTSTV